MMSTAPIGAAEPAPASSVRRVQFHRRRKRRSALQVGVALAVILVVLAMAALAIGFYWYLGFPATEGLLAKSPIFGLLARTIFY